MGLSSPPGEAQTPPCPDCGGRSPNVDAASGALVCLCGLQLAPAARAPAAARSPTRAGAAVTPRRQPSARSRKCAKSTTAKPAAAKPAAVATAKPAAAATAKPAKSTTLQKWQQDVSKALGRIPGFVVTDGWRVFVQYQKQEKPKVDAGEKMRVLSQAIFRAIFPAFSRPQPRNPHPPTATPSDPTPLSTSASARARGARPRALPLLARSLQARALCGDHRLTASRLREPARECALCAL